MCGVSSISYQVLSSIIICSGVYTAAAFCCTTTASTYSSSHCPPLPPGTEKGRTDGKGSYSKQEKENKRKHTHIIDKKRAIKRTRRVKRTNKGTYAPVVQQCIFYSCTGLHGRLRDTSSSLSKWRGDGHKPQAMTTEWGAGRYKYVANLTRLWEWR